MRGVMNVLTSRRTIGRHEHRIPRSPGGTAPVAQECGVPESDWQNSDGRQEAMRRRRLRQQTGSGTGLPGPLGEGARLPGVRSGNKKRSIGRVRELRIHRARTDPCREAQSAESGTLAAHPQVVDFPRYAIPATTVQQRQPPFAADEEVHVF